MEGGCHFVGDIRFVPESGGRFTADVQAAGYLSVDDENFEYAGRVGGPPCARDLNW